MTPSSREDNLFPPSSQHSLTRQRTLASHANIFRGFVFLSSLQAFIGGEKYDSPKVRGYYQHYYSAKKNVNVFFLSLPYKTNGERLSESFWTMGFNRESALFWGNIFAKIWQNNFVPLVQHKNNTALSKFSLWTGSLFERCSFPSVRDFFTLSPNREPVYRLEQI